jgi:glycosyltransferase involved in cell wall biosynthesis
MKKILFVDHTPFAGGAQLVLAEHLRYLDRTRFLPLVACTDTVPALLDAYGNAGAEVRLTPLPRLRGSGFGFLLRLLSSASRLRRLIRDERIDLVVSNTSRAAFIASVAVLGTGTPLVWWVRDFLYGRAGFRLFGHIPRRIVTVSRAVRAHYGGEGDSRFEVVYVGNGIYHQLAGLPEARVAEERARWGFEPEDFVVGFMGRLVAEKGIQDLIEAIGQVRRDEPRVKLLIVGTGSGQEGDVESEVRERVRELGLSHVVFAGYQSDEALFYRLFDLFVLSSRVQDAYATSLVQALMAERPVVATATGGTPEIVENLETGLLVPPGDPTALAVAITRLVVDPDLARRLARTGHERVMGRNREERTTAEMERIYDELTP